MIDNVRFFTRWAWANAVFFCRVIRVLYLVKMGRIYYGQIVWPNGSIWEIGNHIDQ